MEKWQTLLQNSITTPKDLQEYINCDTTALREVIANFPTRINPYFLNLIQPPGDPIWKQAIPDLAEIHGYICSEDPLGEDFLSPVPNLVHKYPDRVLLLVTNQCAMYCRFCTRKRKVGTEKMVITDKTIEAGYTYLRQHPSIREVLISGGEPLPH
jgi:lysine 2,3-aminomutase